jgi:hydroxymethylbilane synthase
VRITTTGDVITDRPYEAIGPKGVFAAELEHALLDDRIDVAVHSLKDLPATEPEGLELAAVCERGDARDVLVSRDGLCLQELPAGARVGTSSARRRALLAIHRPDVRAVSLRGNVDTRLKKVRTDLDAAVLAGVGIQRLGREDAITEWLDPLVFVPPPGQGAIVIESRAERLSGDLAWVREAEHAPTRACVAAERVFMQEVEGGCEVPLGAWARIESDGVICEAFVAAADGSRHLRDSARGSDPRAVGSELARRMLEAGAGQLRELI